MRPSFRAMSLIEMMVVAAVSAVLAAGAVASISSVAARQKSSRALELILGDIQQQRAAHVAAGREEALVFCVDCVDDTGAPQPNADPHVLDVFLAENGGGDACHGRLVFTSMYDLTLSIPDAPSIELDALGRSIDDGVPTDRKLKIVVDGKVEEILFGKDGRLVPTFGAALPALPPHAQNLSSRTTPNPMPRGSFTGDPVRAAGLPLH